MPNKTRVLFVCVHNSARSQMAEAFLNSLAGDRFVAESAGLEPGTLNRDVVAVMKEIGIDISGHETNDVFDFFKQGRLYRYVITVCDKQAAERCPSFPGTEVVKRLQWSFPDPSAVTGTDEERLAKIRIIRDEIKDNIRQFINGNN